MKVKALLALKNLPALFDLASLNHLHLTGPKNRAVPFSGHPCAVSQLCRSCSSLLMLSIFVGPCGSSLAGIHSLQETKEPLVEWPQAKKQFSAGLQLTEHSRGYLHEWKLYLDCSARALLSLQQRYWSCCGFESCASSNNSRGIKTVTYIHYFFSAKKKSILSLLPEESLYIPLCNQH